MENSGAPLSTEPGTNDNLESVRDLLFGKRTAEISGRIEETEQCLRDAIYRMEERVERKLGVIEGLLEDQTHASASRTKSVDNRLKVETDYRIKQGNEIRKALEQVEASFTEKIVSLEERFHKFETIVWNELHALSVKQEEEFSGMRTEIHRRIEEEYSSVADQTADLAKLGDFLIDLGLKIQPVKISTRPESQPELAG